MALAIAKPAIEPGLRVRSGNSPIWTVAAISAGYAFIAEWPKSASVELTRFWDSFAPVYDDEPEAEDGFWPRQRLAADDDSVPTDEDMIRIHSDGSFWAEPEDALLLYKRWLEAHDQKIYAQARRAIEEELGIEPAEEN